MDFDPRDTDDPRDRDGYGRELSRGSRGGPSNPRERVPLDARDIFTRDLELPRGHERERVTVAGADLLASVLVLRASRQPANRGERGHRTGSFREMSTCLLH